MKPLSEWTEAELQAASDWELHDLLCKHLLNREPEGGDMLSGNGMLEVLGAMDKNWECALTNMDRDEWECVFYNREDSTYNHIAWHKSLPRAVAVAALLAVKEKK